MKDWLKKAFTEHKWVSILVLSALVIGILMLCIGFWRTVLLAVLVGLAVLFGYLLDKGGVQAVKDFFRSLFGKRG